MTLRLLDEAKLELKEAAHWYEEKRDGLGGEFIDLVERAFAAIERNPKQFARLDIEEPAREIRRCVLKRFPFLLLFEVLETEVLVVAVVHGKRKPRYWESRLK